MQALTTQPMLTLDETGHLSHGAVKPLRKGEPWNPTLKEKLRTAKDDPSSFNRCVFAALDRSSLQVAVMLMQFMPRKLKILLRDKLNDKEDELGVGSRHKQENVTPPVPIFDGKLC